MIIYSPTGETLLDVMPDDNSYRHRAMMGDNSLTLYFSLLSTSKSPSAPIVSTTASATR